MYIVVQNLSQIMMITYLFIQLHEIILKTFDSGRHLLINDCRGIPKDATEKAIYEKDLKSIIKGHIKKNYEVFCSYFFLNTNAILRIVVDHQEGQIFPTTFFPSVLKENRNDLR